MPAGCAAETLSVAPTLRSCVPPELKVPVVAGELVNALTAMVLLPLVMLTVVGNVIA